MPATTGSGRCDASTMINRCESCWAAGTSIVLLSGSCTLMEITSGASGDGGKSGFEEQFGPVQGLPGSSVGTLLPT